MAGTQYIVTLLMGFFGVFFLVLLKKNSTADVWSEVLITGNALCILAQI